MAITCEWSKPLGTCYSQYDEQREDKLTIYGGGNCLAVFTDEKKNLENFIIDKKHFLNCEYTGEEYVDIEIYTDRIASAKKLVELLIIANFEFTVKRREQK